MFPFKAPPSDEKEGIRPYPLNCTPSSAVDIVTSVGNVAELAADLAREFRAEDTILYLPECCRAVHIE